MNQDRMGQIEKWIFIGCGVLGAIFIGVLILFFVRLGNNTQEVQGMVESQEGTESITENEAVNQEEGVDVGQQTAQTEAVETVDAILSEIASESASSETFGTPVVFTSNAAQSTEGDWLFV